VNARNPIQEAITEMLTECLGMGFEAPLNVAAVAVNGAVFALRYTIAAAGEGLTAEPVAQTGQDFKLPINIFLSDSRGEAARLLIANNGKRGPVLRLIHQEGHSEAQPPPVPDALPKGSAVRGVFWIALIVAIAVSVGLWYLP
jgi:hypothetical protein